MFDQFVKELTAKIQGRQQVQIGRALNLGRVMDTIYVQVPGERSTRRCVAATEVNSDQVVVIGNQVYCATAPRVIRQTVSDQVKVRQKPKGVVFEEGASIKWLLVTVKESTNELIFRIGGYQETPVTIQTLSFDPIDDGTESYFSDSARSVIGANYYFGFRLDMTGTGEDDWVLSYGKYTVTSYNPTGDPNGFWTNGRDVTLYKVTPGGSSTVFSESIVQQFSEQKYEYYPTGYGGWLKLDFVSDFPLINSTTNETLYWDGNTYTSTWYFSNSPVISYTGDVIVLPGETRENNYTSQFSGSTGQFYSSERPPIISESGTLAVGPYAQARGAVPGGGNFLFDMLATPVNQTVVCDTSNFYSGYASDLSVYDTGVYALFDGDGNDLVNTYHTDSTGQKPYIANKLNLDGSESANVSSGDFYTFQIPVDEYDTFSYFRARIPIYYFPE